MSDAWLRRLEPRLPSSFTFFVSIVFALTGSHVAELAEIRLLLEELGDIPYIPDNDLSCPPATTKNPGGGKANKAFGPNATKIDRVQGPPTGPRFGRNAPPTAPRQRLPAAGPHHHPDRAPKGAAKTKPQVDRAMSRLSNDVGHRARGEGSSHEPGAEPRESTVDGPPDDGLAQDKRQGAPNRDGGQKLGTNGRVEALDRPADPSAPRSDRVRTDLDSAGARHRTTFARATALASQLPAIPVGPVVASTELEEYRSHSIAPSELSAVPDGWCYRPLAAKPRG
ncbi:hypothetical protein RhiJN_08225 [Ceratobasidium sp. AG-Ba]|nr:hypothetical protein RhiJN_08225 [Ceratobasidium sp. AG-Ba]